MCKVPRLLLVQKADKARPEGEGGSSGPDQKAKSAVQAGADVKAQGGKEEAVVFIKSKAFSGAKAGYVFKKGPQGVGYYVDRPPVPSRKAVKQVRFGKVHVKGQVHKASCWARFVVSCSLSLIWLWQSSTRRRLLAGAREATLLAR
jgi:hypothetical protein